MCVVRVRVRVCVCGCVVSMSVSVSASESVSVSVTVSVCTLIGRVCFVFYSRMYCVRAYGVCGDAQRKGQGEYDAEKAFKDFSHIHALL